MNQSMKKMLSALLVAAVLCSGFALSAAADFNAAVFTASSDYKISSLENGTMEIALNKAGIPNYADASIVLNDNDLGLPTADTSIFFGADGTYVFRLVLTYTNTTVPSAQKVIFMTKDHRYSFTPAVTYAQAENGKLVETMVMNLASAEALKLVQEISASATPVEFSIQGAAKMISGTISFKANEAVDTMVNNYILAGGLQQNLSAYEKATPCDILELVNFPGTTYNYNQFAAAPIVNNGNVMITKDPTSEIVAEGGNAIFIATATNFNFMNWRLVSPLDGSVIYMNAAPYSFTGLSVVGDGTQQLTLCNIPASLNGWMVEAVFTGNNGSATTQRATITVNKSATSYLFANPSSGYFQNIYTNVVLTSTLGDRIAYTLYRDGVVIGTGTINSGETVWVEGVANEKHTVSISAYSTQNPSNAISCSYTVDCIDYNNFNGVYYNNNYTNYSGSNGTIYYYNPNTGAYTTNGSTVPVEGSKIYLGTVDTSNLAGLTEKETQDLFREWVASTTIPADTEIYNNGAYGYGSSSYIGNNGQTVLDGIDFSNLAGLSQNEINQLINEWLAAESIPD